MTTASPDLGDLTVNTQMNMKTASFVESCQSTTSMAGALRRVPFSGYADTLNFECKRIENFRIVFNYKTIFKNQYTV